MIDWRTPMGEAGRKGPESNAKLTLLRCRLWLGGLLWLSNLRLGGGLLRRRLWSFAWRSLWLGDLLGLWLLLLHGAWGLLIERDERERKENRDQNSAPDVNKATSKSRSSRSNSETYLRLLLLLAGGGLLRALWLLGGGWLLDDG